MQKSFLTPFLFIFWSAAIAQNSLQSSQLCVTPVGTSVNQLTTAWGPKTNLWYDQDIDALTFTFAFDTSSIGYAYSLNQGASWTVDTMLYHAPSIMYNGRFPQGLIYNPPGNTNPSNAYITCFGSATDGTSWNSHYEGTALMGSGTNLQTLFPFSSSPQTFVPQGGTIVKNTGTTWWSAAGESNGIYNDTIVLAKGTFGGGNFSYTYTLLPVPVCTDNNGKKMFRNQAVIFDDSGLLGVVAIIGNDWVCNFTSDSAMGIIVYITMDGGNTWYRDSNPDLNLVDPLLQNNFSIYAAATQLDIAFDMDNNLHIGVPVIPFKPGNAIDSMYTYGTWGLFDFSISIPGLYWMGCLVAKPHTGFGYFGNPGGQLNPYIREESRLQLSRSWNGEKIFYTWFDTDTTIFGNVDNIFCDMHTRGKDITTGNLSADVNITQFSGTSLDGSSLFGNVSYYTFNDGTNEHIPVVANTLLNPPFSTGSTAFFSFVGCDPVTDFNIPGDCVISNSVPELAELKRILSVSNPYPNPCFSISFIDVTLLKSCEVTIEISNAIGQVFSSTHNTSLRKGKNTLMVDASSLRAGLYFYTASAGGESITRILSVE